MYTNVSSSYLNWETGLALGSAQGRFAVRDKKTDAPLGRNRPTQWKWVSPYNFPNSLAMMFGVYALMATAHLSRTSNLLSPSLFQLENEKVGSSCKAVVSSLPGLSVSSPPSTPMK